ncbi:uncharacterized protein MELLADRAFT_62102 [Melampsora larici-populina 98AG31]|uniref:Uncharacterized protein n=1 Tax=Melampsora larici-populina (strain 98AG31 / pathotype 3-4-7) TaxID=747676 RepID=F4RHK6_MELLP|nr:uncharacterized protein MELLADRAFT_62102 [Melampsora larici-populina 98AG31]EGG08257.1 hypothetical protein MELLADRAFT_62102 [Melampsora larici-populina 98AG31]
MCHADNPAHTAWPVKSLHASDSARLGARFNTPSIKPSRHVQQSLFMMLEVILHSQPPCVFFHRHISLITYSTHLSTPKLYNPPCPFPPSTHLQFIVLSNGVAHHNPVPTTLQQFILDQIASEYTCLRPGISAESCHTSRQVEISEAEPTPKFTHFNSDVIVNTTSPRGVSILIASNAAQSSIRTHNAYRIEGTVAAGAGSVATIFEDGGSTIALQHAQFMPDAVANKVSAQGIGRIVEWSSQPVPDTTNLSEVIKVLHEGRDSTGKHRIVFHAHYVVNHTLGSTLSPDALSVGNIIVLRGNFSKYNAQDNTWVIETTEVQLIYNRPHFYESVRRILRNRALLAVQADLYYNAFLRITCIYPTDFANHVIS